MKKIQQGYTAIELFYVTVVPLFMAAVFGWGWNIVKIIHSDFGNITGLLVCRVIGVFVAPVGALLGFF